MNSANHNKSKPTQKIGSLGEEIVARWLQQLGFKILARRWHCLWGEIDLVALLPGNNSLKTLPKLIFVEVKTRSQGNWDAGGLLAITPSKQGKIKQAAALFLVEHPDLADSTCQFDVALVCYTRGNLSHPQTIELEIGKPVSIQGYTLYIQNYIESAFD
jgi:putative endonuclease